MVRTSHTLSVVTASTLALTACSSSGSTTPVLAKTTTTTITTTTTGTTTTGAGGATSTGQGGAGGANAGGANAGGANAGGANAGGANAGGANAGGANAGGANAGGANAGGAGGSASAPLLPLAVGHTWTYDVTTLGAGDGCSAGGKVTKVLAAVSHAGKDGFTEQNLCYPDGKTIDLVVEGDRISMWNDGAQAWVVAFEEPVEEGHSWAVASGTRTWHDAGTVTVPAGTFDHCWRADQTGTVTGSYTYCRGVGLVAETNDDGQGNGSDVKLAQKSF
jgi:PPE-repeat protein